MNTDKLMTIARPYALAAFEYALAKQDLAGWGSVLQTAAAIAQDKRISQLLRSPTVTSVQLMELFCDILAKSLDTEKKNFIRLLAEKERLIALPEIAELYALYQAQFDKTITVQVISASALSDAYQQKLADALSKRLKRHIAMQCEIDPSLLGGAMIRAGDLVIDGTIRGKLNRMIEFI